MTDDSRAAAILLAAGRAERMGGIDKALAPLGGIPLLEHSLSVFQDSPSVDEVVVVASPANIEAVREVALAYPKAGAVVPGGERRRDSVRAGLDAAAGAAFVLVHDAARPFLSPEMIGACLAAARGAGAAICVVPVADTIKRSMDGHLVRGTVSRAGLYLAQTPQCFRRDLLLRAHEGSDVDATDDAALVEHLGEPIWLVPGSPLNLKVTTPEDLVLAEAVWRVLHGS
jgi:2-C-methyl-D-erythritol 4-phosphate cytidylyltransferase